MIPTYRLVLPWGIGDFRPFEGGLNPFLNLISAPQKRKKVFSWKNKYILVASSQSLRTFLLETEDKPLQVQRIDSAVS